MLKPYYALLKLPKILWVLFFVTLINRIGTMVLPFLTLYLTDHKGFSVKNAGIIFALYGTVSVLISPFSGALGDKFGAPIILFLSLFLSSITLFLFPYANTFTEIVLVTVLFASFNEFFRPVIFTLASKLAPEGAERQVVVLIRLAANMGMSIGPALGGWLIRHSFRSLFYVDGTTSLLAAILIFIYFFMASGKVQTDSETKSDPSTVLQNLFLAWKNPKFTRFWLGIWIVAIVFFQHECTWPIILVRDYHLSENIYGSMFTLNTIIIIFCEVPLLARLSKVSHNTFFALGTILMTLGIAGISQVSTSNGVYFLATLFTFGEIFIFPIGTSFVTSIAPRKKMGSYMGSYNMAFNLSLIVAPLLGTFLLDSFGPVCFSVGMGILGLVSFLLLRKI